MLPCTGATTGDPGPRRGTTERSFDRFGLPHRPEQQGLMLSEQVCVRDHNKLFEKWPMLASQRRHSLSRQPKNSFNKTEIGPKSERWTSEGPGIPSDGNFVGLWAVALLPVDVATCRQAAWSNDELRSSQCLHDT